MWINFLAVGIGAGFGAMLRYQFVLWFSHVSSWLALGTLCANLVGGFLMGIMISITTEPYLISPTQKLFFATGFLGGLTTFSTFSAEVFTLIQQEKWLNVFTLMNMHLIGSVFLTAIGFYFAMWIRSLSF